MQLNACRIDDFGPLSVEQPHSIAELGDLVRRAAAEKQAVYPLGGQTLIDIGLPPIRPGFAVDLRGLSQVIDYPARDMTITVQAGITLAKLQSLLATENQRLPIDVPHPEQATLGGVLATNISGSRRLGFGTLRDYVIGISTINDEGQEVKAGGRVVKNVAGYDLCKLHIGALGTLGIISQVTLKLRPRPEGKALVTFGCATEALGRLLDQLHQTRTRPVCLDLLNSVAVRSITRDSRLNLPVASWVIVVGFEDNSDAVGWQVRQLLQEIAPADIEGLEARAGDASESLWHALAGKFHSRPTFFRKRWPRSASRRRRCPNPSVCTPTPAPASCAATLRLT
ncbi:MAG TPA: FAD-binding oxidoreductase [Gemmataceae bacterium]|nr:FAD-binding oxidoreductase [Gemmataceae bacterium]